MTNPPSFAIIVPFFNEEQNVEPVCLELKEVIRKELSNAEIILINDGSKDASAGLLDRIASSWPECRVYHLNENRGQAAALLFGFSKTSAAVIITMDGDGQNDPRDIPKMLARLKDADMVVGVRVTRRDSWLRRKISRIANSIRSDFLGDGVSDSGCGLKVFRSELTNAFIPIRTLYSFMPAMAVAAGFRVVEEAVNHRPRKHGSSKYTITSFLFFPVLDFIGLRWFNSRRCDITSPQSLGDPPIEGRIGEHLHKRVSRRWAAAACLTIALVVFARLAGLPPKRSAGPEARKVSLHQAEQIALQRVRGSKLGTEELRREDGRLVWMIDVQRPDSQDLNEIEIDAMDGQVIAARRESAEEEQFELAAENPRFTREPQNPR